MQEPARKERQSVPVRGESIPPLTEEEKARQEALNTLLQYDRMTKLIDEALSSINPFRLRPHVIQDLNRISIQKIESDAGRWRDVPMRIEQSQHDPPPATEVPRYIDEMCEYVNNNFINMSALHLAAYVMWRLNWIHPFIDGNGRTTRAVSYYILCVKLGFRIPGVKTIPELIAERKQPYYKALEAADRADANGTIDVEDMESLLKNLLATQMVEAIERADSIGKAPMRQGTVITSSSLRQIASRPPKAQSAFSVKAAAVFGAVALLFFMALTLLSVLGYEIPTTARFLIVIVLALSGGLSTHFLGGHAIARGSIPLPKVQDHPIWFTVGGGSAVMFLLLILGYLLFL